MNSIVLISDFDKLLTAGSRVKKIGTLNRQQQGEKETGRTIKKRTVEVLAAEIWFQ